MSYYFTYGTLMSGKERSYIMDYLAKNIGVFEIKGYKLYDYAANDELIGYQNYPVAIYTGKEEDIIIGEVWESNYDDMVDILDKIEGYPTLYTRESVYIEKLDIKAVMYVGNIDYWGDCLNVVPFVVEYPSGVMWDYRRNSNKEMFEDIGSENF